MGGTPFTWSSVVPLLEQRGHSFSLADNHSQSLYDDEANVRALIDAVDGPVLLVGHSYGGAVITAAGTHDRVVGLVYVAAFAPDGGESVSEIVSAYEPAEVSKYFTRGADGEWIPAPDEESWRELAWDVPEEVRLAGRAESRVSRRCDLHAVHARARLGVEAQLVPDGLERQAPAPRDPA